MIENMRKYTGLMVVVFILLGAGFLFTMNDIGTSSGGGMGSGPTYLEAAGRSLDQQEYRRMGDSTLQLASEAGLHTYVNFLMVPDARQLQQAMQLMRYGYPNYYITMGRNLTSQDFNRFIANRIIIQKAIEDMGIYASDEEVSETIKTSQRFAPDGKFNEADYATFVDKRLGKLGMTEKDLREVVRENLCLNKLIEIIGGGLLAPRNAVRDQLEAQLQTITLARIVFNRDDFVEKEDPTEEEIKAYWETHQDAYKTEEQRRINYFLIDLPAAEKEELPAPIPPLAADATEEQKKAHAEADKARTEAIAKAKAEKDEANAKAGKELRKQINDISQKVYDRMEDKLPLNFEEILAESNHTLVKTGLFTQANMPKEIADLTLRGNVNQGRSLAEEIFGTANSKDPYDLISDPLPVGEHGWIIYTLEEVVVPELLDYAAARNKARAQLIAENGSKKVKEAAKAARDAIVELMKSGKSFDAAAKEKGLVPVQVGPFSLSGVAPKDEPSFRLLHQKASGLNPGEVSETIDENDRSLFFYVDKREIEDTEESKRRIDFSIENNKNELMILTFLNWINHQYQSAEVKGLATQEQ
ncbi:MAG: SurA N-terminal domain-containing protein [Akkermansiaceae bacterium]|nr:SurA N-terminal domain-containing protein [Akkermansiaceae bacterium]